MSVSKLWHNKPNLILKYQYKVSGFNSLPVLQKTNSISLQRREVGSRVEQSLFLPFKRRVKSILFWYSNALLKLATNYNKKQPTEYLNILKLFTRRCRARLGCRPRHSGRGSSSTLHSCTRLYPEITL